MFSDIVYAMAQAPQQGQPNSATGAMMSFLMIFIIILIFYFLIFRPQIKRANEHKKMLESLKKGDKIITQGGIYGLIESLDQHTISLKIAEKVKIKITRSAVATIRTDSGNDEKDQ
jgi:preprotein translocase subunit YajC